MRGKGTGITTPTENEGIECKKKRIVHRGNIQIKSKNKIRKEKDHLNIEVESTGAESFTWPKVEAENYTLPLWEGKQIPSNDENWKKF